MTKDEMMLLRELVDAVLEGLSMAQLTVMLSDDELLALGCIAHDAGLTMSDCVRQWIRAKAKTVPKLPKADKAAP